MVGEGAAVCVDSRAGAFRPGAGFCVAEVEVLILILIFLVDKSEKKKKKKRRKGRWKEG